MRLSAQRTPYICSRCLRERRSALSSRPKSWSLNVRHLFAGSPQRDSDHAAKKDEREEKELGAMSRRLSEMSEGSLETGGRSARKAVEEAGFDEDLKRRLEERIANASFRNEFASAIAQAELPAHAGKATRDIAGAKAWTGTEPVEDASLRMLNDAYKPMKGPVRPPPIRGPPPRVDTGRSKSKPSSGARLANARDKTSIYSSLKDENMSESQREAYRKELKERFTPVARTVPASIQGLASLANERYGSFWQYPFCATLT